MSRLFVVDLFVEDRAHEELLKPIVERVAREEKVCVTVHARSARGGHGRALNEFRLYQMLVEKRAASLSEAELVVVAIDANCASFLRKRTEIQHATRSAFAHRVIAACPDPHVERWYLADPESFHQVVGARPAISRKKCARDHYKNLLAKAVRQAGHPVMLGGVEFAREIVEAMDWYRAGKNDGSFKAFVDELRGRLQALRDSNVAGPLPGANEGKGTGI